MNEQAIRTIYNLMLSIAYFEGYFQSGSRARRNNNPGNLRGWSQNNPKDDKGFDRFPNAEAGWNALWRQVWLNVFRDLTLREFFYGKQGVYPGYAPLSDNNPASYARWVSTTTGIPLDNVTILSYIRV
jgi:hypothetical protein